MPGGPPVPAGYPGYVNPLADNVNAERIDQGVDYSMPAGTAIKAIGNGIVRGIIPDFYTDPNTGTVEPSLFYELTDGYLKGDYVYISEEIQPLVSEGDTIKAGQTIATYAPSGTGLEIGFASHDGNPLAQATGGWTLAEDHASEYTAAGLAMSDLIAALGGKPGKKEGPGPIGGATETLAVRKALGYAVDTVPTDPLPGIPSPSEIASDVVNAIWGLISGDAEKVALYTVLTIGAIWLMGKGVQNLIGSNPVTAAVHVAKVGASAAGDIAHGMPE